MIATDDRHPPTVTFYTPKCCKLHDDSFLLRYIAQPGGGGGYGKPTAHAHVICSTPYQSVERHAGKEDNGVNAEKEDNGVNTEKEDNGVVRGRLSL